MENDQTILENNLFRNQQRFSKFFAISSVIIICIAVFLGLLMTDVEFYGDVLMLFNLLYLIVFMVGYSIFFILNIIKYNKYKLEHSKTFLKLFILIFLLSAGYFFIVKYFMNDGMFNLLMVPRDTGTFLFHSIFIWINLKVYRNSKYNIES